MELSVGHNAAFVTATAALNEFWRDDELTRKVNRDARGRYETRCWTLPANVTSTPKFVVAE